MSRSESGEMIKSVALGRYYVCGRLCHGILCAADCMSRYIVYCSIRLTPQALLCREPITNYRMSLNECLPQSPFREVQLKVKG